MPLPIVVTFDHAQRRISRDRLSILAEGSYPAQRGGRVRGWDLPQSDITVWQDDVTYTAMLMPSCWTPEWHTTNSGATAKYGKSDLTFSDGGAGWDDIIVPGSVGWIKNAKCDEDVIFTPTLGNINQGMYIGMYAFSGADTNVAFECGWSDDGSREVALRFYSGGQTEVWKGGELVGTGQYSGATTTGDAKEKWVGVLLLPFRRRELLVYSTAGSGFAHVFDDLAEDGEVQEIVPNTKFWIKVPSGTATLQIGKAQFATAGDLVSPELTFADPPETGATEQEVVYWDEAGYGSTGVTVAATNPDLSGAFVPDGEDDKARIVVGMTGGPSATPFVYAAMVAYPPEVADTDDEDATPVDYARWTLDVPDSPDGAKATVTLRNPVSHGVEKLDLLSNRPVQVTHGDVVMIDGRSGSPKIDEGLTNDLDVLSIDVYDDWQGLKNYRFQERIPLDGLQWIDCVEYFLEAAGVHPDRIDVHDPEIEVGTAGSPTAGEWSLAVEPGDTAAEWLERLFEGFAGDWFFGFVPQAEGELPVFYARPPDEMTEEPDVTLWLTAEEAMAQLVLEGADEDTVATDFGQRLVRAMTTTRIAPEANDVRVTGIDVRKNAYLQAKYIDEDSLDPTLPVDERPDNWVGERLRYGYVEPMLTTQDLVNDAAATLGQRITRVRTLIDWEGEMVFLPDGRPLWRGHMVQIGEDLFRVRSMRVTGVKEPVAWDSELDPYPNRLKMQAVRNANYTAELIEGETPWAVSTGRIGSKQIRQASLSRLPQVIASLRPGRIVDYRRQA